MKAFDNFLVFATILCGFVSQSSKAECQQSVWRTQLVNHVMSTLTINDIDSCYRICAATHGCQSINYFRDKSLCELNSRTIGNTPSMRISNDDSVYFSIPGLIPDLLVDGNFTEWSKWTSCSVSCGNGTRYRNRFCTNPPPAFKGKDCTGPHNNTQNCNPQPCSPASSILTREKILAHWALNGSEKGITYFGGPIFVEGRLPGSKAIAFTNLSSYARIPKVGLRYRSFTIAIWIKVYNILSRSQHFFSDWHGPNWNFYFGILHNGRLIFSRYSEKNTWPSIKTKSSLPTKEWKHVAVTWNVTSLDFKLYINTKEVHTEKMPHGITWRTERPTFDLGDDGHYNEKQFLGELMDLYIIDGAMNNEMISSLFNKN